MQNNFAQYYKLHDNLVVLKVSVGSAMTSHVPLDPHEVYQMPSFQTPDASATEPSVS